jgi:hypothetical protein
MRAIVVVIDKRPPEAQQRRPRALTRRCISMPNSNPRGPEAGTDEVFALAAAGGEG